MVTLALKRRHAMIAAAALSMALGLLVTGAALKCCAQASANFDKVAAVPVQRFRDSIGVNTHVNFSGSDFSGYRNTQTIINALQFTGIRHIRDGGLHLDEAGLGRLAQIATASGAKINFELGSGGEPKVDQVQTALHRLLQLAPGSLSSVEGPNEINNLFQAINWQVTYNGRSSDMCLRDYKPVIALQKDLYKVVKSDPLLKDVPVYNFSMVYLDVSAPLYGCHTNYNADLKSVGNPTKVADYDAVHDYPFQGSPPRRSFKIALHRMRPRPDLPAVLTETGYSTGEATNAQPTLAIDEDVQAKYLLNAIFDSYTLGAKRTFIYELMDDSPDTPASSLEKHYGLFHADGTPKPAAVGLHNLMAIMGGSGAEAASASIPLSYSLSTSGGDGYDLREMKLLLEKPDGTYLLVLWAEPSLWSTWQRHASAARKAIQVKLRLSRAFDQVTVYDPLLGASPVAAYRKTALASVELTDHPIVIAVK